MMVLCTGCKTVKECSEFYPSTLRTSSKWCKNCLKASKRAWGARNREKERARVRAGHRKYRAKISDTAKWRRLRQLYGITKGQYIVMMARQEHRCAICYTSLINVKIAVDHNHATNEVRGLLCDNCNRGIGLLKDNSQVLTKASRYISTNGFGV